MPRIFLLNTLDDRGMPLSPAPREQIDKFVWHDRTPPARYRNLQARALIFVLLPMSLAVVHFLRSPGSFGRVFTFGPAMLPGLFIPLVILGYVVIHRLAQRRDTPAASATRPHDPLVALLAAHRDCGACGYSLREAVIDPDGCCVCPECGAAWHRDRWTLEHTDLHSSDLLADTAAGRRGPEIMSIDDRGVPLPTRFRSFVAWLREGAAAPDALRADLTATDRAARRRFLRIGITSAGALWLIANVLHVTLRNFHPRDRAFDIVLFAIVTALIAMTPLILASRPQLSAARCRAIILSHSRCPCCRRELGATDPVAFDGCTPCAHCGRAWRLPTPG